MPQTPIQSLVALGREIDVKRVFTSKSQKCQKFFRLCVVQFFHRQIRPTIATHRRIPEQLLDQRG